MGKSNMASARTRVRYIYIYIERERGRDGAPTEGERAR